MYLCERLLHTWCKLFDSPKLSTHLIYDLDYRKTMSANPPRQKAENEFGMQTLPTFSPFTVLKISAVAVKTKTGGEFNMYDVEIQPVSYVGKRAVFRMNSTTLDRLRAVLFLSGDKNCKVDASWSTEQKTINFSAQLNR